MNNDLIIFLPNIILLVLFIIFLWWRRSLKSFDWLSLVAITLGISLLAIVIILILNNESVDSLLLRAGLIAVPAVMFILFLFFLMRILSVEKMKAKLHFDERVTIMNAKSARNALVAVYLSSVINLIIHPQITWVTLLAILGVSLLVYLSSIAIYYYRSF